SVAFAEGAVAGVLPAAVGLLPALERLEQFTSPCVLFAIGVGERFFAPRIEGFAEGVVVVVKTRLAHAGILFERVVPASPADRRLDAWIVLRNTGVQEALQAAVAHRAQ